MKRVMVMLLAMALLMSIVTLPASAANPVQIYIDAPAQAESGDTIGVSLYVNNGANTVGGVEGTVTFNTDMLTYVGVELREDVQLIGNVEEVTVREVSDGVKFVTVSNVAGGNAATDAWLTLKFTVNATSGDAAIGVADMVVSNWMGDAELTLGTDFEQPDYAAAVSVITVGENDHIDLDGATIKTSTSDQGIRFQTTPDASTIADMAQITEVGVVMLPADLLYEGQDLTKDVVGRHGATPAIAKIDSSDAAKLAKVQAGEEVFATLKNGTTGGRANRVIAARSYVVVNGVTVYSYNDDNAKAIVSGEAEKTLVGVAQAIAANEISNGATNTLGDLLTKQTTLTDAEVTTLLTFCRENISHLKAE